MSHTHCRRGCVPQNLCVKHQFPNGTISARFAPLLWVFARSCAGAHRGECPSTSGLLPVQCQWSWHVSLSVLKKKKKREEKNVISWLYWKTKKNHGMMKMTHFIWSIRRLLLLTHSLLQTQAPPGQGGGQWSPSRSTHGCGAPGGNSIALHIGQRSTPSLYCSPAPLPKCCMPSALYSYSLCKTCGQNKKQNTVTSDHLRQDREKLFRNKCWQPNITCVFAGTSPASLRDRHYQLGPPHPCTPETSAPIHPSSFLCKQTNSHQN